MLSFPKPNGYKNQVSILNKEKKRTSYREHCKSRGTRHRQERIKYYITWRRKSRVEKGNDREIEKGRIEKVSKRFFFLFFAHKKGGAMSRSNQSECRILVT